jgi:hypothetical protein
MKAILILGCVIPLLTMSIEPRIASSVDSIIEFQYVDKSDSSQYTVIVLSKDHQYVLKHQIKPIGHSTGNKDSIAVLCPSLRNLIIQDRNTKFLPNSLLKHRGGLCIVQSDSIPLQPLVNIQNTSQIIVAYDKLGKGIIIPTTLDFGVYQIESYEFW